MVRPGRSDSPPMVVLDGHCSFVFGPILACSLQSWEGDGVESLLDICCVGLRVVWGHLGI